MIGVAEAFMAAARQQQRDALHHARTVLAHADALAISNETRRWAWPLAARAALALRDTAATGCNASPCWSGPRTPFPRHPAHWPR